MILIIFFNFFRFSDKITFIWDVSSLINALLKKAITDTSHDTGLAPDCDTESDLSGIGGEIEESNSDICDSSVDERDNDQVYANTAIGRDNCTVWCNERPSSRRNVHQHMPHNRAGVNVGNTLVYTFCYN